MTMSCPSCMFGVIGKPGLRVGPRLSSSSQPGWQLWWLGEWQGGHNHLTLEKQSDTKGFNALPWVWATAIGFDSRVIMRGGRLEVFTDWGLEEKRVDGETEKWRGGESLSQWESRRPLTLQMWAPLSSSTLCHPHTLATLDTFPSQKGQGRNSTCLSQCPSEPVSA